MLLNLLFFLGVFFLLFWNIIFGLFLSLLFSKQGVNDTLKEIYSDENKVFLIFISFISFPSIILAISTAESVEIGYALRDIFENFKRKIKKFLRL